MKIGEILPQEHVQQEHVLETTDVNPEQEQDFGLNRHEASLVWLCPTENEELDDETSSATIISISDENDENLTSIEREFSSLTEDVSLSLDGLCCEAVPHNSSENQGPEPEKLFTSDYCLISTKTPQRAATKMSLNFFLRRILDEHIVLTIINVEEKKMALTFEDLQSIVYSLNARETNTLLRTETHIEDRCFNVFQPLLSQEYKNKFLFVNEASMNLQLALASRDLGAFSSKEPYVLQTFMMHHDGMMLSFEPFSAPIGSFNASFLDLQNLNIFNSDASFLLVETLLENKQKIANTAFLFSSASNGEISAFTISVQPYFYLKSAKKGSFKFSSPTAICQEEEILNIDCNVLFDIKDHELLMFASENVERVFSNFQLKFGASITMETSVLFVFKIAFLNNLQQLFGLLKGNVYYVKSLRRQERSFVFYAFPSETHEHKIGDLSSFLPPAAIASSVFQDEILKIDSFKYFMWCYTQSLEQGVLLERVIVPNDVIPIGSNCKLEDLKNFIKQQAQHGGVLSLVSSKTKIKDFLVNPLLTHLFATCISADDESLTFQAARLEHNLDLLSAKNCVLETRFVLLDGFVTNLEAFDILLLVSFDSCDKTALMQALNDSAAQSLKILANNGFLKRFKKLVNLQTRLFYTNIALEATSERCSETDLFSFSNKTTFTTFFYNYENQENKEWKLNSKKLDTHSLNIQSNFQGIRVFKLSLCTLNDLSVALKANNGFYRYSTFEQLKLTNGLFCNTRLQLKAQKRKAEPDCEKPAKIPRLEDDVVTIEETNEETATSLCLTGDYEFLDSNKDELFRKDCSDATRIVVAVFYDEERGCNVAFTQANFRSMKRRAKFIPEEYRRLLLMEGKNLENRAFNLTFPFARQNYVDNLLFVNNVEFDAQLQLIRQGLKAFSNKSLALSTLSLPHDGVTLSIKPFSCMLGAFYISEINAAREDDFIEEYRQKISKSLTGVVKDNQDKLVEILEQFTKASNGEITHFTIGFQIFLLGTKEKTNSTQQKTKDPLGFFFPGFLNASEDFDLWHFNMNHVLLEQLKFEIMPDELNNRIIAHYRKREKLFVFKLFALNYIQQTSTIIKKFELKFLHRRTSNERNRLGNIDSSEKQLATLLPKDYAETLSFVYSLLGESITLFESVQKGVLFKLVLSSSFIVPLGCDQMLQTLRELYCSQKITTEAIQNLIQQNSLQQENVTVSYLMQNVLFAHQNCGLIPATNLCFEFQLKRLRENLEKFSSGKENLQTEFVCFDGACFSLEPFEVVVGVFFEKPSQLENSEQTNVDLRIKTSASEAIEFYKQNGFVSDLEKIIGKKTKIAFADQSFKEHYKPKTRKSINVNLGLLPHQRKFLLPLFYVKGRLTLDKIIDLDALFRVGWSFANTPSSSVRMFKVSLCSVEDLCLHLAKVHCKHECKVLRWAFGSNVSYIDVLQRKKMYKNLITVGKK